MYMFRKLFHTSFKIKRYRSALLFGLSVNMDCVWIEEYTYIGIFHLAWHAPQQGKLTFIELTRAEGKFLVSVYFLRNFRFWQVWERVKVDIFCELGVGGLAEYMYVVQYKNIFIA